MKTELTHEQTLTLIKLGADPKKASGKHYWNINNNRIVFPQPVFKLEDFLNGEILPKEIIDEEHKVYNLNMECITGTCGVDDSLWIVSYDRKECSINWFSSLELIDALYQLTCWYYGEYLKSEKK